MPRISVIIPTVREIDLNLKCLDQQDFTDFETIVVRPTRPTPAGHFYQLNHDYNQGFKKAKGELIVSYQDGIAIQPDTLTRFWYWHTNFEGKACIGAVGDQFSSFDPPVKVWTDPRRSTAYGTFYEVNPVDIEFTLCAIPKSAIYAVGGMDEEYDRGAAVGEKEMMHRIDTLGYKSYLDQSLEYKALKHDRLTKDWDKYYRIASSMYSKHLDEIQKGSRQIHLDYLI